MDGSKKPGRWETYASLGATFGLVMLVLHGSGIFAGLAGLLLCGFAAWGMTESLITFRLRRASAKANSARDLTGRWLHQGETKLHEGS